MSREKPDTLLALVQSFFHDHLSGVRGASKHTIRAYRDALGLFFAFLVGRERGCVTELTLDDIQAGVVLTFLNKIESVRNNSAATRNHRLAAIRSFVKHLLRHDLTRADQYGRILAISKKKSAPRIVTYLEPKEARSVIKAVDIRTPHGARDHALL